MKNKLKDCPYCKDSWIFVSDGGYASGYESKGYKVNCMCGFAWNSVDWQKTEEDAIKEWNKVVRKERKNRWNRKTLKRLFKL